MSRRCPQILLTCVLAFVLAASAHGQVGAKSGWVYYGLLVPAAGGSAEQWVDVNVTLLGAAPGSKKPAQGMQLKSGQLVTLRQSTPSAQTGPAALAPIVGVVAAGSVMNIMEVAEHPVTRGVQYWVKVQS